MFITAGWRNGSNRSNPNGVELSQGFRWLLLGILLIQFVLVAFAFPLNELLTQTPIFHIDSPFHWYKLEVARDLASKGHVLGYNPYFAAGYLDGVNLNAALKLPALLGVLAAPWLSSVVMYKLFVFAMALLGPLCIPVAARWMRLPLLAATIASTLALLLWWVSAIRWYHTAGMVTYIFVIYLALPYAALVIRYLTESTTWKVPVGLAAIGALGMFIHPEFPIPVVFLVLALLPVYIRRIAMRRIPVAFVVIPVACLLPNLFWLIPMFGKVAFHSYYGTQPYQQAVNLSIVWDEALGRITHDARGARLNIVLWLATLWACVAPVDSFMRRLSYGLIFASVGLILFAALGAAVPIIAKLQPNRFSVAGYLYLCVPAAVGFVAIFDGLSLNGVWRILSRAGLVCTVIVCAFFLRELGREVSTADIPHHGARPPIVNGLGHYSTWLLSWLTNHTDKSARILFQVSKGRIIDDAHMASYFALQSDREFIGGPYPFMLFPNFSDDQIFGKSIDQVRPHEVWDYIHLYNIGWIVAFSEEAKRLFGKMPGLTPGEGYGPFKTWVVAEPHSFFVEGSGRIVASKVGWIELDSLKGDMVTLKYHYIPGMRSVPPVNIESVQMKGDPIPFVRIVKPPRHLVIEAR